VTDTHTDRPCVIKSITVGGISDAFRCHLKIIQIRCIAMPSLMVLFFVVCGPKYTKLSLPVQECPSLQHHFPIDNVLLHSGDIHDQDANLPKF